MEMPVGFRADTFSCTKGRLPTSASILVFRPTYLDRTWAGKDLLFSRWGTWDPEDARVARNGWVENSGHEGNFVGVRAIYLWTPGEYKCELAPVDVDHHRTWYEFKATSKQRNQTVSAGCLRFPSANIETGGGSWTEVYSGASSERDVPFTEMRVSVVANGGGIRPIRCDTTYNSNFQSSDAFIERGQLVLRSGAEVQRLHSPGQFTIDA
jgi:hypothetical protein